MQNYKLLFSTLFFATLFLFPASSTAHASILDDAINGVKKIFAPEPKKEFTIESNITHAPGGDINKDKQIDAGDTIRFTYTIKNRTEKEYTFASLKTNINRKQITFIHNVTGTASLTDDGNTIAIPNLRINPQQEVAINFDARIKYSTQNDISLTTEPQFMDKDKKSIAKSVKKEIRVKKIVKEKMPRILEKVQKSN